MATVFFSFPHILLFDTGSPVNQSSLIPVDWLSPELLDSPATSSSVLGLQVLVWPFIWVLGI